MHTRQHLIIVPNTVGTITALSSYTFFVLVPELRRPQPAAGIAPLRSRLSQLQGTISTGLSYTMLSRMC